MYNITKSKLLHTTYIVVAMCVINLAAGCEQSASRQEGIADSAANASAGNSEEPQTRIIRIEKLPSPQKLLTEGSLDENFDFALAHSKSQNNLVMFDHPFFNGMYSAYSDHRPFDISPDAIWLLICQGFSNHVNTNAEELRHLFVNFDGKQTLTVYCKPHSNLSSRRFWESQFPKFTKQISQYVGNDVVNILGSQFSTSTPTTTAASQITIMASMQAYFNYRMVELCGIPYVILEGTPSDWNRILDNVEALRKYKLDWWIDEIEPILQKIAKASQGEQDPKFWKEMFKEHDLEGPFECGDPRVVSDGWIVKFYPYLLGWDDKLERNTEYKVFRTDDLPSEMVSVPLVYEDVEGSAFTLKLHAGFIGLAQDHDTYALRPEVGWYVSK